MFVELTVSFIDLRWLGKPGYLLAFF